MSLQPLSDPTQQEQKPNRLAFDSVIRQRLGSIDEMGQQQNQFAAQQAAMKQQEQITAQRSQMQSAQQQGQQNSYQQQSQPQNAPGQYGNQTMAQSRNPRNPQQALEWAKQAAASGDSSWYRRCLAFVAQAYGLPASGTNYAIDAYTRLGQNQRHDGDRNPNVGSLLFYNTGSRAGHVALYAGNGMAYSNDIGGRGKISLVPVNAFETKWGAKYAGWADPAFAAGGG